MGFPGVCFTLLPRVSYFTATECNKMFCLVVVWVFFGDEILPSYLGIIINQYYYPY